MKEKYGLSPKININTGLDAFFDEISKAYPEKRRSAMIRLLKGQNSLIENLSQNDGKRKCVLVVSHALILGWITNIHEILSAGN